MRDFAFYNAGVDDARGPRRLLGLTRRLLRRILRPIFFRQEAIYREMQDQIDRLNGQVEALSARSATTDAFGWDYVAMSRRLAAIEDHLCRAGDDPKPESVTVSGRRTDAASRIPSPHPSAERARPVTRIGNPGLGFRESGSNGEHSVS